MTTYPSLNSDTTTSAPSYKFLTIVIALLAVLLLTQTGRAQTSSLDVYAPHRKQATPSKFVVPITASDLTNQGIIAFQFNILYDPTVITPAGTNFGCSTNGTLSEAAGMIATCNVAPAGTLRVAVYGAYPLSGSGTVLNLKFATATGALPGAVSSLNFDNIYFFNEQGYVTTSAHNGRITLSLPLISGDRQSEGIQLSAPTTEQKPLATFLVPITAAIPADSAITAFQFSLVYDPAVIHPDGPNFGCSTQGTVGAAAGTFAICNVMPEGVLNVSVFSPYPLGDSGTLLNLTFTATDGVTSERHSALDLENVRFFGTAKGTAVNTRNGHVTLSEPTLF
jgi:hypothetical protein